MKIITFGYHTSEVQSLLYFGKHLIKEPSIFCLDTQFRNKQSPTYIYHLYEPGTYNIPYNSEIIVMNIKRFNYPPIELKGDLYQYFIEVDVSHNNSDTLEQFLKDAEHFYKKDVLMTLPTHNEILIYNYKSGYHTWKKFKSIPTRDMDTLYLPDKKRVIQSIDSFHNKEEYYRSLGIPYKMNFLLDGIPGSGKTTLIQAIASKYNMGICVLNNFNQLDDDSFIEAILHMPKNTILCIEEIETVQLHQHKNIGFHTILNFLDGHYSKHNCITFITTNSKTQIDKRIIRPGRIDMTVKFKHSQKEQVQEMFCKFYPTEKMQFERFYGKIKSHQFPMSALQSYFISYGKTFEQCIRNVQKFSEFVEESSVSEGMYG